MTDDCCKTHAAMPVQPAAPRGRGPDPRKSGAHRGPCSRLHQGKRALFQAVVRGALGLALAYGSWQASAAAAACPGPALRIEPLAEGLWLLPSQLGDADPANRGVVSNLVLARQGQRWWLLGSGPSPAHGRALACLIRQRFGHAVTDVVSPWARPELVLGQKGLAGARRWAHAEVAQAMRVQCAACVVRLHERLGAAAADLGPDPVVVPDRLLHGESGQLGPFRWWLLPRAAGRFVTVWRHEASGVGVAHGLLAAEPPGDGRDADLKLLHSGLLRLADGARADGARARWVPEQGALLAADAPATQARYWRDMLQAVGAAIDAGADESAPAQRLSDWPEAVNAHPWHALNWQRAWRQVEAQRFDAAPK